MAAYYNEFDEYAAQWLRNLIAAGHIADGVVDNRSISDVEPNDLRGFTQCHFFAGIGVWSFALRLAGWPDERGVWTGSCPCQPFSSAGLANGFSDERHLWPHWHHLIRECRPETVFGEQVASKDGLNWLDLVQSDMEGEGYAFAANDICAAGVGAPHIRQRLYFVADANEGQRGSWRTGPGETNRSHAESSGLRNLGILGDDDDARLEGQRSGHQAESGRHGAVRPVAEAGESGGVAHSDMPVAQQLAGQWTRPSEASSARAHAQPDGRGELAQGQPTAGPTNGHWRDADWLFCRDGKWRPVEPGTFPLVNGATSRVGRLRAYGNAIVPQVAQTFIEAFLEVRP